MIFEIFSVYDKCAGTYGNPIVTANEAVAKRDFVQFCCDPKVSFMASDLQLYKLGTFDSIAGTLTAFPQPQFICGAQSVPAGGEVSNGEA